ncbi:MAG: CDGSH iron-sulfur domain-containing protein [Gammaproteobacteria bacterium]|nr:CDGSH iron-sulfur domain-containing protein [Gammaproteobacteria bacterium]
MSEEKQAPWIKLRENGPYLVHNVTRLTNSKGATLQSTETMALCRCGHSANKPFCDGSHKAQGFSGDNLADPAKDKCDQYQGKKIVIRDNRSICAHVGKCTDGLPLVWRMGQEPWIDADGADVAAIIEVIQQCPSGALSYTLEDEASDADSQTTAIFISHNGPYYVTGPIELADAPWGRGASRTRYALCRCGASKNKPFCDGSHWSVEFRDDDN